MMRPLCPLLIVLIGAACAAGPELDLGDDFGPQGGAADAGADSGAGGAPSVSMDASALDAEASTDAEAGTDAEPRECTRDDECDETAPRCDEGRCVECREASDCGDEESAQCEDGRCTECEGESCEEPCSGDDCCATDSDCDESERPHCLSDGRCVECTEDAHCAQDAELRVCIVDEGHCE